MNVYSADQAYNLLFEKKKGTSSYKDYKFFKQIRLPQSGE